MEKISKLELYVHQSKIKDAEERKSKRGREKVSGRWKPPSVFVFRAFSRPDVM
jgi:hypothetical protein